MTPQKGRYQSMNVERNLMELVKLELALKKHFVYIDHIDELKHKELVIREFDKAIRIVDELIRKLKVLRSKL